MKVKVEVVEGPEKGRVFEFQEPCCFLFGRTPDAYLPMPDDPFVSLNHFMLEIAPPLCKVVDLESKNGTYVNDVRYGGRKDAKGKRKDLMANARQAPEGELQASLRHGDTILVGQTRFRVSIEAETPPPPVPAAQGKAPVQPAQRHVAPDTLPDPAPPVAPEKKAGSGGVALPISPPAQRPALPAASGADVKTVTVPQAAPDLPSLPGAPAIPGYKLVAEIGAGGMGKVYKAIQSSDGRTVAIKTMLPRLAANPAALAAFVREIEISRQLVDPNIVHVLDHGRVGEMLYLVLEFVDGMDLKHFVQQNDGRLTLRQAAPIMLGILRGLGAAHTANVQIKLPGNLIRKVNGVVHRDLKGGNVLLAGSGKSWIPKIADFGLSKAFETAGMTNMTMQQQVAGTPLYWPREQITHYRYLCPASDVFSIAAVFYEILTGELVRDGFLEMLADHRKRNCQPGVSAYFMVIANHPTRGIRQRDSSIPQPVADAIDRALKEEILPQEMPFPEMRERLSRLRYPNAGAFHDALSQALRKCGLA